MPLTLSLRCCLEVLEESFKSPTNDVFFDYLACTKLSS